MKRCIRQMAIGLALGGLLSAASGAMAAPSHPVQIRPGFITGSSDVGIDANVDILVPLWNGTHSLFFFNPNFRIDDNDGNEQNVGFGFRRMSDCGHFIAGANIFYDSMRSERNNRYQQWGLGAEILSHWFDLRANYYDPFGDTENEISRTGTTASYFFSGNSLMAGGGLQIESEEALKGFDAEVSVLVPGISKLMETRLAGTYYNFDVDGGKDLEGWRGRLEFRPVKAIDLSIEYRDDDVRGRDTFFGGYLELPFSMENLLAGKNPFKGAGDLWSFGKGARPLEERMTDKVVRDRHIVTAATETQTGAPLQALVDDKMIFVNQDNTEVGDGSYENPYRSLESATADARFAPGAWVYVFSSDETADTYANAHVTLLDDMVFWGQGYRHPVYGLGGGPKPILDGGFAGGSLTDYAAASVVVLADNNEVMGLTIQNGFEGIYGNNIKGANIHHNQIRWNPVPSLPADASGIHISNRFSPAEVNGQILNFTVSDNEITDNGSVGIYLKNELDGGGSPFSSVTFNNTISGNTLYGNFNSSSDADADANMYVSNYVSGGGVTGLTINNSFTDNTISHCVGESCTNIINYGIKLRNEINLYVSWDSVNNVPIYDGDITTARFNNLFSGNTITGLKQNATYNSGTAIFMEQTMMGDSVTDVRSENTFTGNTLTGNDGSGIYSDHDGIRYGTGSITNAHHIWNISGNILQDNGRYGFHANNDYFSGQGDRYNNSSTEFSFRDNRITGNGRLYSSNGDGIYLYTDTSQDAIQRRFLLEGNLIAGNTGDGVDFYWNGTNPASMQSDFGGGALGSTGGNAFFDNSGYDINQDDMYFTTSARNNWWGQAGGPVAGQIYRPTLLDASSPLTANPFP